jgi:hypothetical protein
MFRSVAVFPALEIRRHHLAAGRHDPGGKLLRCLAGLTDDCLRPGDPAVQFWGRMHWRRLPIDYRSGIPAGNQW